MKNKKEMLPKQESTEQNHLTSLKNKKATLERKLKENKRVMEDKNTSPNDREAAEAFNEEGEEDLARLNRQIQEREEALPLRERVKNVFKKYGWTLQTVVLAAGLVIAAVSLAASNALKAGTKAVGNGLKAIGKKVAPILPGLIGTIVSFLFKTAGQVVSFLGEHAWLLILAVVAFLMERILKKKRR